MIVLDTNVISEALRPAPDRRVVAWLESLGDDVAVTAITVGELLAGLRRLPEDRRRARLTETVESALRPFRGTSAILPFGDDAASWYAQVLAQRDAAGLPIATADAQIAAICLARGATCATRNVRDFAATGVALVNPWDD